MSPSGKEAFPRSRGERRDRHEAGSGKKKAPKQGLAETHSGASGRSGPRPTDSRRAFKPLTKEKYLRPSGISLLVAISYLARNLRHHSSISSAVHLHISLIFLLCILWVLIFFSDSKMNFCHLNHKYLPKQLKLRSLFNRDQICLHF